MASTLSHPGPASGQAGSLAQSGSSRDGTETPHSAALSRATSLSSNEPHRSSGNASPASTSIAAGMGSGSGSGTKQRIRPGLLTRHASEAQHLRDDGESVSVPSASEDDEAVRGSRDAQGIPQRFPSRSGSQASSHAPLRTPSNGSSLASGSRISTPSSGFSHPPPSASAHPQDILAAASSSRRRSSGNGSGEVSEDGGASLGRAKSVSSVSSVNSTSSMEAVPFRAAPLGNVRMGYGGYGRAMPGAGGGAAGRWPGRRHDRMDSESAAVGIDVLAPPEAGGPSAIQASTSPSGKIRITPKGPSDDWLYRNAPGMGAKGRGPMTSPYRSNFEAGRPASLAGYQPDASGSPPSRPRASAAIRSKLAKSAGKLGLKPLTSMPPGGAAPGAGIAGAEGSLLVPRSDEVLETSTASPLARLSPEMGFRAAARSYFGDAGSYLEARTSSVTHAPLVVPKHPPGPPGTAPPPSPGLVGPSPVHSPPLMSLSGSNSPNLFAVEVSSDPPMQIGSMQLQGPSPVISTRELDSPGGSTGSPGLSQRHFSAVAIQQEALRSMRTPSPGIGISLAPEGTPPTPAQQIRLDAQAGIARAPAEPSGAMPGPNPVAYDTSPQDRPGTGPSHRIPGGGSEGSDGLAASSAALTVSAPSPSKASDGSRHGDRTVRGGASGGGSAPRRPALLRALTSESALSKRSSKSSVSSAGSRQRLGSDTSPSGGSPGQMAKSRARSPRRSFRASLSPTSRSPVDTAEGSADGVQRRPSLELRTMGLAKRRSNSSNLSSPSPVQRTQTPLSAATTSGGSDGSNMVGSTTDSPSQMAAKVALPTLLEGDAPIQPASSAPGAGMRADLVSNGQSRAASTDHSNAVSLTSGPASAVSFKNPPPMLASQARPPGVVQMPATATQAAPVETVAAVARPAPTATTPAANVPANRQARGRQDFEFGDVLGEGSYSTVLEAWDLLSAPASLRARIATEDLTTPADAIAGGGSRNGPGAEEIRAQCKAYAVKVLDKVHILKEKKQKYVGVEKEALSRLIRHPGVITLYWTFQDRDSLYFVLELAPHGELLSIIKKHGSFDEESTRYYAAQILETIAGMHAAGVIHRDMKPENVLLDADMRVKVTDFGSAKVLPPGVRADAPAAVEGNGSSPEPAPRSSSFVGTAEYVSPELLTDKAVSASSDWWAFGCILFQMIAGRPPFKGPNEYMTFQKIIKRDFEFPEGFPEHARDLVDRLLQLDPKERLGAGPGAAADVRGHAFFQGVDWDSLWTQPAPEIHTGIYARPKPASERSASFGSVFDEERWDDSGQGSVDASDAGASGSDGRASAGPQSEAASLASNERGTGGTEADDDESSASDSDISHSPTRQRGFSAGAATSERPGGLRKPNFLRRAAGMAGLDSKGADGKRGSSSGLRQLQNRFSATSIGAGGSAAGGATGSTSSFEEQQEGAARSPLRHSASMMPFNSSSSSSRAAQSGLMSWAALLLPREALLYSSVILQRKQGTFRSTTKARQLLLTDFPRLLCVKETQDQLQVKSEIILAIPAALTEPAPAPPVAPQAPRLELSVMGLPPPIRPEGRPASLSGGSPFDVQTPTGDHTSPTDGYLVAPSSSGMVRLSSNGTVVSAHGVTAAIDEALTAPPPASVTSAEDKPLPARPSSGSRRDSQGASQQQQQQPGHGQHPSNSSTSSSAPALPAGRVRSSSSAALDGAPNLMKSIEAKGARGFVVHTPARSYHFEDPHGDASHWIRSIKAAADRAKQGGR